MFRRVCKRPIRTAFWMGYGTGGSCVTLNWDYTYADFHFMSSFVVLSVSVGVVVPYVNLVCLSHSYSALG